MASQGLPSLAAYSAASAGVIAFTKALSREVSDTEIRVNCVAPGPIDTRMIRDLSNETVDAMIAASPLRRLAMPGGRRIGRMALLGRQRLQHGCGVRYVGGRARY
jgi:NAD(P)-dependent dehydrogenase (short-subunit alcohol dehydrogenase family)